MPVEIRLRSRPDRLRRLARELPAAGLPGPESTDRDDELVLHVERHALDDALRTIQPVLDRLVQDPGPAVQVEVRDPSRAEPLGREHRAAFQAAPGLRILPCLPDAPPQHKDRATLLLDQACAFGSGLHPTTRMCLELLPEALRQAPAHDVLDLGCGSGVLGLAALLLGAQRARCVDVDPEAVAAVRRNARLNGLEHRVEPRQGSLQEAPGRFDLILANLAPAVLFKLAPLLPPRLRPCGALVLSGAGPDRLRELTSRLAGHALVELDRRDRHPWAAVALGLPGEPPSG